MNQERKKVIGVQFKEKELEPIEKLAREQNLRLAWIVRKCTEIALPIVAESLQMKKDATT